MCHAFNIKLISTTAIQGCPSLISSTRCTHSPPCVWTAPRSTTFLYSPCIALCDTMCEIRAFRRAKHHRTLANTDKRDLAEKLFSMCGAVDHNTSLKDVYNQGEKAVVRVRVGELYGRAWEVLERERIEYVEGDASFPARWALSWERLREVMKAEGLLFEVFGEDRGRMEKRGVTLEERDV